MRAVGTRSRWVIGVVTAAALAGAVLAFADAQTPARMPLALVFLLAVPGLAVATLFGGLRRVPGRRRTGPAPDVLGTVVIAGTAALVIDMAIAESMIATGTWSLRLGIALVALVSVVIAASRPLVAKVHGRPARSSGAAVAISGLSDQSDSKSRR